jgi:hypothetical protein
MSPGFERLAAIVIEDFGPGLRRTQFNEVVLLMFPTAELCSEQV